jgi:hypothetical protein
MSAIRQSTAGGPRHLIVCLKRMTAPGDKISGSAAESVAGIVRATSWGESSAGLAQAHDPFVEAGGEQLAIERVERVVQRIVAGNAFIGEDTAQEAEVHAVPAADLDEVLRCESALSLNSAFVADQELVAPIGVEIPRRFTRSAAEATSTAGEGRAALVPPPARSQRSGAAGGRRRRKAASRALERLYARGHQRPWRFGSLGDAILPSA